MKRFAFLCGLVAALLCLAQNASAQYAGPIHRNGAYLADARGNILSDQEVLTLIGEQVYDETYVGASKQRKTGKTLIWSGIGGLVGGAVLYGVGVSKVSGQVNQNSSPSMELASARCPVRSIRTAARKISRKPSRTIPARLE